MRSNFITKIKATQKLAKEKNVHNWYNCVLQSIMIIFITSSVLSVYTITYVFEVDETTPINEIPVLGLALPFILTMAISYVFLEKLIIIHISLYEKIHKIIFNHWQKFDMWYFRRYRKHSPLTENLSKLQAKQAKLSKKTRKIIIGLLIASLILFNVFIRIPYILESIEDKQLPVIDQETEQEQQQPKENEYQINIRGAG